MNKIRTAFNNKKTLIPYLTCGDPDLETTATVIRSIADEAAVILLGIPFSDPTAEVPVRQESSLRALKQGVTTDKVFDLVEQLRQDITVPIVLSTYANVVFSYGTERFLAACQERSINGLLIYDVPYEERDEFLPICRKHDVDLISVIAPCGKERMKQIVENASGFLYLLPGVDVKAVKALSPLPCATEEPNPDADGRILVTELVEQMACLHAEGAGGTVKLKKFSL